MPEATRRCRAARLSGSIPSEPVCRRDARGAAERARRTELPPRRARSASTLVSGCCAGGTRQHPLRKPPRRLDADRTSVRPELTRAISIYLKANRGRHRTEGLAFRVVSFWPIGRDRVLHRKGRGCSVTDRMFIKVNAIHPGLSGMKGAVAPRERNGAQPTTARPHRFGTRFTASQVRRSRAQVRGRGYPQRSQNRSSWGFVLSHPLDRNPGAGLLPKDKRIEGSVHA